MPIGWSWALPRREKAVSADRGIECQSNEGLADALASNAENGMRFHNVDRARPSFPSGSLALGPDGPRQPTSDGAQELLMQTHFQERRGGHTAKHVLRYQSSPPLRVTVAVGSTTFVNPSPKRCVCDDLATTSYASRPGRRFDLDPLEKNRLQV